LEAAFTSRSFACASRPADNEADADPRFEWDSNAVLSETWQIFEPGTSGMLSKIPRSGRFCQEQ
jgi:hypothetical protein